MQTKLLRICCFLLLIICALLQLQFAVFNQLMFTGQSGVADAYKAMNEHQLTHRAKELQMLEADLDGAYTLVQRALLRNPLHVPAWLALIELFNDRGQNAEMEATLDYVDELTKDLKKWRWEKALTAYQTGHEEMLPDELEFIIREIPGKTRNDALQLAFSLWDSPENLVKNVGVENVPYLFNYAVWKKQVDKALFFWPLIEGEEQSWSQPQLVSFLNMLISVDRIEDAKPIWRDHFNEDTILYNGDFSKPLLRSAFGWRIGKDKGFEQKLEQDGGKSKAYQLYIRFKGWENLNLHHLSQIVPLESGRQYKLSVEMKSQKITTNERPFVEVYGFKCTAPYFKTDMVKSFQDWTPHEVTFGVPKDCAAMVVRLRRKISNHIDNKLSGKLWLRNISIEDIGEDFSVLDVVEE